MINKKGYSGPYPMLYYSQDEDRTFIYDMDVHGDCFASERGYPLYADAETTSVRVATIFFREGNYLYVKDSYPLLENRIIKNMRIQ